MGTTEHSTKRRASPLSPEANGLPDERHGANTDSSIGNPRVPSPAPEAGGGTPLHTADAQFTDSILGFPEVGSSSPVDTGPYNSYLLRSNPGLPPGRSKAAGRRRQGALGGGADTVWHKGLVRSTTTSHSRGGLGNSSQRVSSSLVSSESGLGVQYNIERCRSGLSTSIKRNRTGSRLAGGLRVPEEQHERSARGSKDVFPSDQVIGRTVPDSGQIPRLGTPFPTAPGGVPKATEQSSGQESGNAVPPPGGGYSCREDCDPRNNTDDAGTQGCGHTANLHTDTYTTGVHATAGSGGIPDGTPSLTRTSAPAAFGSHASSPPYHSGEQTSTSSQAHSSSGVPQPMVFSTTDYDDPRGFEEYYQNWQYDTDSPDYPPSTLNSTACGTLTDPTTVNTTGDDGGHGHQPHRGRLKVNDFPTNRMNVIGMMARTPCPVGRLSLKIHFDELTSRRYLRPLQPSQPYGPLTPTKLRYVYRKALAAGCLQTMPRAKVGHLHSLFLRLKGNGREYRMLIDATGGQSVNSYNNRLPRPPRPPAFMSVAMFLLIVLASPAAAIGVDDISVAFNQMGPMTQSMTAALGVAVRSEDGAAMVAGYAVVPQGGTWSPVVCQSSTLVAAFVAEGLPTRLPLNQDIPPSDQKPAPWRSTCIRCRRLVHVDDVVSVAPTAAECDEKRRAFRQKSEAEFGVKWKEFQPSSASGDALGINVDLDSKTWAPKLTWSLSLEESMAEWPDDKLRGCANWVSTVLQIPPVGVSQMERSQRLAWLAVALKVRAQFLSPPSLDTLDLPITIGRAVVSDASTEGWAGSATGGVALAGRLYRCKRGGTEQLTLSPCCGGSHPVIITPGEVYLAEAMASAWTFLLALQSLPGEYVVMTDSSIWADSMARGYSPDATIMSLLVLVHILARGHAPVAAHIPGGDRNPADTASHTAQPFDMPLRLPTPSGPPRRTILGRTATCGTLDMVGHVTLPCSFDDFITRARRMERDAGHVPGCRCLHD